MRQVIINPSIKDRSLVVGVIYVLASREMRRVVVPGSKRDARRMRYNHVGPSEGLLEIAWPQDPDILAAAKRAYAQWKRS